MIFKMIINMQSYYKRLINVLTIWIISFHKTKTILSKTDKKRISIKLEKKILIHLMLALAKNSIQINLFQIQRIIHLKEIFLIKILQRNLN